MVPRSDYTPVEGFKMWNRRSRRLQSHHEPAISTFPSGTVSSHPCTFRVWKGSF